ncbi:hypothetical protein D3C73_871450 [compost metagenome]
MHDPVAIHETRQRAIGEVAGFLRIAADGGRSTQCIWRIADHTPTRVSVAGHHAVGIVAIGQAQIAEVWMLQGFAAEQAATVVLVAVDGHRPGRVILRADFDRQSVRCV